MSENKKNLSASGGRNVGLHDDGLKAGSMISQAISRLSKEQADNLIQKAGDEALRLESKQHELNIEYVHAKKTVEDHVDTFNMLEKGGRLTTQKVTTDVKSGNSTMRIESTSGAKCFVATVAYQDENHPDVIFLRKFRDSKLSQSKQGRSFIDWYWRSGPKLAALVEKTPFAKLLARFSIGIIVKVIKLTSR